MSMYCKQLQLLIVLSQDKVVCTDSYHPFHGIFHLYKMYIYIHICQVNKWLAYSPAERDKVFLSDDKLNVSQQCALAPKRTNCTKYSLANLVDRSDCHTIFGMGVASP